MSIAWSFSCEISVLGISHLPRTTPKTTIFEPYKHLRIAKAFIVMVDFGCGQFRTFCPGLGFWQRYHVDRHGQLALKQLRLSVLNEMHTNSYTGPGLYPTRLDTPEIDSTGQSTPETLALHMYPAIVLLIWQV